MTEQLGKVFLVGSGLGGEGYLTIQARQILAIAEVLLYDALTDGDLLSLVPQSCLKLDVGKRGGQPSMPQKEINRLLVQYCQAGKLVVRLKSGDPFVFGRGQAELRALREARCVVEVIPGLSSALAAPALAGIPLTDPTMSRCFAVMTAHDPDGLNWRSLADLETLVILMGGSTLPEVVRRLQGHGRSPQTPIAVIRWAGRPQQRIWEGTLADILAKTEGESLSPCVIVIGEVVCLRHYLSFVPPLLDAPNSVPEIESVGTAPLIVQAPALSESKPLLSKLDVPMIATPNRSDLTGKTILVTRAATQASQFLDRLAAAGAIAIEMPALEIVPPSSWEGLDREIKRLPEFDWLVLTSANAVESFFERLQALRGSMRLPTRLQLAVVGDKTATALKQVGFDPDFVPPEFVSDSMAAYFPGGLEGSRVLFPRVESGGRELLVRDLTAKGASVVEVAAYQSRCPEAIAPDALAALQTRRVNAITFASSKTVKHFCQMLERSHPNSTWQTWLEDVCIASIGPQTSKACEDFLGRVDAEAREYNLDGLIQAIEEWFEAHPAHPTQLAMPDLIAAEVVELAETDVVEIFDFDEEPSLQTSTATAADLELISSNIAEPIESTEFSAVFGQPASIEIISPMSVFKGRDLLSMADLSAAELRDLLQLAADLKAGKLNPKAQKTLGLLFYKASTRTRVSFSAAMYRLGGQVLDLNPNVTQVSRGEPLPDTARVLDRYLDILAIRTFEQKDLEVFADYCQIPVINALTDLEHPCQVLADLQTAQEVFGGLAGLTLAYIGDGNNMANSLLLGCALAGMNIRIASPEGYQPTTDVVEKARELAGDRTEIMITTDPNAAVNDAQVIYTDVWASMGQEGEAESRMQAFQAFQVNRELMAHADSQAVVLHCLPAHRGEEITEEVMEGSQSRIWDQAENRMHAQQALMASLLGLV